MAWNLITSVLSLATSLLPSITASVRAPSTSTSNSDNSQKERARAVEDDLKWLIRTLERIKATLYDAEEREIIDRSVKLWLKELKKVAYDTEDVLSEYRYEVTRVQVEARKASEASGSHKRKHMEYIEYIVQIPDGMVDRLNKIRSRFDEIAKHREALQLRESDGARRPNNKILRPPTGHMVDKASIFGRDAEIEKVIDSLLSEKEKPFSVISIIGKGGLGKTTIAQLVYKDERVTRCFDLFGWVCVSEEFDVGRLTKAIIESVSKINYTLSELSSLQEKLAEIVKGKTILLVLDDVWNENQSAWELLRVPFKEAKLVRILVTTRNKKVADVMQTTTYFRPTNLPEDLCWKLFQHYAFSGTSDTVPKQLVDVGREIMKKCGGLPLAVKSIACLLRRKADEEFWREILESDLWEIKESKEVIFPALQISYAHLPAHLKPCFLFCSMFPKDHILEKRDLIRLWIAHGYIESRSNRKIKKIGAEYYNELKERSFLDDAYTDFKNVCKLHDIIHDLARLNSENEHYSVEVIQPPDIQERIVPQEAYHLYVSGFVGNQIPQHNMKGLRTIFMDIRECNRDFEYKYCTNCTKQIDLNLELTEDCQDCLEDVTLRNLTKFEVLRVLILKWVSLTKIPHSISELKHLTHLSIFSRRLKVLPLSIGLLYNLQALEVDCDYLEYLPENIGDLANLRLLNIHSLEGLKKLPNSLCSLTNLVELTTGCAFVDYVPHDLVNFPSLRKVTARWNVRTIGWLKDMKDIKGIISIGNLKNINNLEDAKRANLRNKCKLEILELCWDDLFGIMHDMNSTLELDLVPEACEGGIVGEDDVHYSLLECLQPHPNLKELGVKGYPSAIIPGWMRDPISLQSIQELRLDRCGHIESLPFGNLHTLKHLDIIECSNIRAMNLEQLPFQLETLTISCCYHLELITGLGHLYKLGTLNIYSCETLKSLSMDGQQLVESTELFGDFSHEMPQIGPHSISSLIRIQIVNCKLLRVLPDGLIPSGPCYVLVRSCGCPDLEIGRQQYIKSVMKMALFPTQEHKKATQEAIATLNASFPKPSYARITATYLPPINHPLPINHPPTKPTERRINALHPSRTHMDQQNIIEEEQTYNNLTAQPIIQETIPGSTDFLNAPGSNSIIEEGWTTVQRKKSMKGKHLQNLGKSTHPLLLKQMQTLREQGKCYKCTEKGHLQAACRNSMKCFKCQGFGHKSGSCKFKEVKPIKRATVPIIAQPTKISKEQHPTKNKENNNMENWQTMPMLHPSRLPAIRHELRRAYVPNREGFHVTNEVLDRAAVIHMGPNCNDRNLPHRLATTLAAQLHRHPRDFKIGKLDRTMGHFLAVFPTMELRNHAVDVGVFAIDYNTHVQLAEWKPSLGMTYDPIAYKARLLLRGVPLNAWNIVDLDHLLAGIGHVLKLAPVFTNENFDTLRVLISCHNPASIPPTLLYTANPYSRTVFVDIEGWLHSPIGQTPTPGGEDPRLQRNNGRRAPPSPERYSPDSDDYSRTLDTYQAGADSSYSRRTRPVQVMPVQAEQLTMQKFKPQLETIVEFEFGQEKERPNKEKESIVCGARKPYLQHIKVVSTVLFKRTWDSVSVQAQYSTAGKVACTVWKISLAQPPHSLASHIWANSGELITGPATFGFQKEKPLLTFGPASPPCSNSQHSPPKTGLALPAATAHVSALKKTAPRAATANTAPSADFLSFLYEDGPLPMVETVNSETDLQTDPFAFLFRDGPPPGFEKNIKFNVRRSPRFKEKAAGPYVSSEQKACKLLGDDFIAPSPKRTHRRRNPSAPTAHKLDYLSTLEPLSASQAEVVVNAAGVKFEEDLHFKIAQLKQLEVATTPLSDGPLIEA